MKNEKLMVWLNKIRSECDSVSAFTSEIDMLINELSSEIIVSENRKKGIAELSRCADAIISHRTGDIDHCGSFVYNAQQYICGAFSAVRLVYETPIPCCKYLEGHDEEVCKIIDIARNNTIEVMTISPGEIMEFIKGEREKFNLKRKDKVYMFFGNICVNAVYLYEAVKLLGDKVTIFDGNRLLYLSGDKGDGVLAKVFKRT